MLYIIFIFLIFWLADLKILKSRDFLFVEIDIEANNMTTEFFHGNTKTQLKNEN